MLKESEVHSLITTLLQLREEQSSKYNYQQNICVKKFTPLVEQKLYKYRKFSNYEDLKQEGLIALTTALTNYDPTKGNFYYWINQYVETRIKRNVAKFNTFKIPIRKAKAGAAFRYTIGTSDEDANKLAALLPRESSKFLDFSTPDKRLDHNQTVEQLSSAYEILNEEEMEMVNLAFGFSDGHKTMKEFCKEKGLSRRAANNKLDNALFKMKNKLVFEDQ